MAWTQWAGKQALRIELLSLGQKLTRLQRDFSLVSSSSSRMVSHRLQRACSEYWKACKAYEREKFERTERLLEAGRIEADFIQALLDAETAERELGESIYFEFGDKHDAETAKERIERALVAIEIELEALAAEARRRKT